MRSIRRVLLFWLLGIVLMGVVLAGVVIYRQASVEANALFDYQLQQTAAALPSEPFSSVLGTHDSDGEGVVIQIWSRDGAQLYYSHPRSPLAPRAELGFTTEHTPTGDWRVYSAIVGDNVVQLGQPMSIRNLLAAETAWRTVWPLLILFPVLGVGVWIIVGRGLRPLSRLARALEARRPEAVDPLPDRKLSSEIRPVVHALNGLLQRLNVAFDTQKAFVADAAHELRTPLAALRIQSQLLERAKDEATRAEALSDLKNGVERATRLVEQLLSLARAESTSEAISEASLGMLAASESERARPHGARFEDAAREGAAFKDAAREGAALKDSDSTLRPAAPGHDAALRLVQTSAGDAVAASVASAGAATVSTGAGTGAAMATGRLNRVDLVALVEACVAAHAPLAIDKGVDLGIEARAPAEVEGDAEALRVMIGNLLDNAVKYTPSGGKVDVSMGTHAQGAFVDIVDTGPGIAPEERQRVFDRFYRSPDVMDAQGSNGPQGSGLGLAIVKRIADRHHAQIVLTDTVAECAAKATPNTASNVSPNMRHNAAPDAAHEASGLHVRVQFAQ